MNRLASILLVAASLASAAIAQTNLIPPAPGPFTNYFQVAAKCGTNIAVDTNVVSTTNNSVSLSWLPGGGDPFTATNVSYLLMHGRQPGRMTSTQNVGQVTTVVWSPALPYLPPPKVHFQITTDLLNWSDIMIFTGSLAGQRFFRVMEN